MLSSLIVTNIQYLWGNADIGKKNQSTFVIHKQAGISVYGGARRIAVDMCTPVFILSSPFYIQTF